MNLAVGALAPANVFNEKEFGEYNEMILDSRDETLSAKKRLNRKRSATEKWKAAVAKRKRDVDGDPEEIAKHKQKVDASKIRAQKSAAISKKKCEAGDPVAIGKRVIKLAAKVNRYESNKKARLAGDEKLIAAYDKISAQNKARKALNRSNAAPVDSCVGSEDESEYDESGGGGGGSLGRCQNRRENSDSDGFDEYEYDESRNGGNMHEENSESDGFDE